MICVLTSPLKYSALPFHFLCDALQNVSLYENRKFFPAVVPFVS